MADISGRNAGIVIDLLFEGKDEQHAVNRTTDLRNALRPPCPNGRAYELNGAYAGRAQTFLESEIEVGRVDSDEGARAQRRNAVEQIAAHAQQPWKVTQHLNIAAHRQLAHMCPRIEAGRDHAVTADARKRKRRVASLQLGKYASRQQIARRLARDDGDAGCGTHQRMMPPLRITHEVTQQRDCRRGSRVFGRECVQRGDRPRRRSCRRGRRSCRRVAADSRFRCRSRGASAPRR